MIRYRILSACLTAKTANTGGLTGRGAYQLVTLYQGSFLPSDCPQEDIDRLLRKGAVIAEEVGE